jgi:uncharacterized repeat protein (TIGR02543 family)
MAISTADTRKSGTTLVSVDNSGTSITAFSITTPVTAAGIIEESTKTIVVTVPAGTDRSNMTAEITFTGTTVNPDSGSAVDFTAPVVFTVTADEISQVYTVIVIEAGAFIVSFDPNDGTPNVTMVITAAGGGAVNLPADPVRAGFVFDGWNTARDGSGQSFDGTSTVAGNTTIYALWTCTVSFDLNTGTGTTPEDATWTTGDAALVLPDGSGITAPGEHKVLEGWNTREDGTGRTYGIGASYRPTGGITLYSKWNNDGLNAAYPFGISSQIGLATAIANSLGIDAPDFDDGLQAGGRAGARDVEDDLANLYYELTSDITLNNWQPVGVMGQFAYRGTFDGNGHTITFSGTTTPSLDYPDEAYSYVGIFGWTGPGAVIKNLNIDGTIEVLSPGHDVVIFAGAVAGYSAGSNYSNIRSSVNIDIVNNDSSYLGAVVVGGIAGEMRGTIISGKSYISNCYTTGAISARSTSADIFVGGIVGEIYGVSEILNSYATGELRADSIDESYVGGIAAYMSGASTGSTCKITNCAALTSAINATAATYYIGRIAGWGPSSSGGIRTNNWADEISVTQAGDTTALNTGSLTDKNGANFTNSGQSSWSAAAGTGPAFVFDSTPWVWDSIAGMPKLYRE